MEGASVGTAWESTDEKCLIGSSPSCDLVLTDPTVSGFHCEVTIDGRYAFVRDLKSRNGTTVDGTRIVQAYLKANSLLKLGRAVLRFQVVSKRNKLDISSRTQFGVLVGRSVAIRSLFAVLERAAASNAKVLLQGETGTGKSATARSIHMESKRGDGPFIMLDCGSIPGNLLESELFGHVRGAFTGAGDRAGAFEEASGGTLFLDEIGELPAELQPKLLTVLDDNRIRRVGESRHRKVDVRVIAATNRDLREEVNAGRFREDLYYRLGVVKLTIPPLRKRLDDIEVLVDRILPELDASTAQVQSLVTEAFLTQLRSAAWPGNIRELRNYLERCLVFDDAMPLGSVMHTTNVGARESDPAPEERTDDHAPVRPMSDAEPMAYRDHGIQVDATLPFSEAKKKAMAEVEHAYMSRLLDIHNGKVSRAAAAAGIDRTYLYRLLRRHSIKKK